MRQLTKEQAIEMYESEVWNTWTLEEIARFQLFQDLVCVPLGLFHEAIGKLLGRPVFCHEFANTQNLRDEYLTIKTPPTIEEIIEMIPEEKRIIINLGKLEDD